MAIELEHEHIVDQLVRSPIDINLCDKNNQTAIEIAVDKNLTEIKRILFKRIDLKLNFHTCNFSENPLKICILDGDDVSARVILENYSFKNWIKQRFTENPQKLKADFSKLLFEVFMVFKEDYKSSIFIMDELVKN